jgi:hypothetical protein
MILRYSHEKEEMGISSITSRIRRFIDSIGRRGKRGPTISMTAIAWIIVLFVAFIAGGGIYDIIDNPLTILPGPSGRWISVHPYMSEQTLNESIVSMILTFSMFAGVYLSYRSTKVAYDQKKANMMLVLGIALTIIGLAGSQYLIVLKRMAASSL